MFSKKLKFYILALILSCAAFFGWSKTRPQPQIYDCFLFFNELELLQIRLEEMSAHVDKFVIVEASETFRGKPKPFVFAENRHLFEKFADKIIYVPLTERQKTDNPWEREWFQREQIFRGLKQCRANDIVLLSDIDEIVRSSAVKAISHSIHTQKMQAVVCNQKMYHIYLNRYQSLWRGTVAMRYQDATRLTAKRMRKLRNMKPRHLKKTHIKKISLLENAGWHFNSMGGTQRYIQKLEAFSHAELEPLKYNMEDHLKQTIQNLPLEPIDSSFPQFVQDNQAYFERIGFLESPQEAV